MENETNEIKVGSVIKVSWLNLNQRVIAIHGETVDIVLHKSKYILGSDTIYRNLHIDDIEYVVE